LQNLPSLVTDLALILLLAGLTTLLCKKLKQPLVLGYILAGFLCGPVVSFLPTIADQENIELWSEIGVIFLMFAVGLEFSIHKLAKVGLTGILASLFEVFGMMLLGVILGQLMGWSTMDSVFLGGMLSISSTMIAIKALEDSGLKGHKFAGYAIGTLIIEDIVAIFLMVILSTVARSHGISGTDLLMTVGQLVFYLALWMILGIFLLPTFLNKVSNLLNDEMLLVISLGICFGMVWIADMLGFSSALGAFLAGSILAGTVHGERIERLVAPCKDLFGAVFFVSVGLLVVPQTLIHYIVPIILITIVTIVGKIFFLTLGMMTAGRDIQTSVSAAFCLTQIGEFSYIIASLGTSLGVTSDFLYPTIVAVSVITAFTTPLMIGHAEGFAAWLSKAMPERLRVGWEKYGNSGDDNSFLDEDWRSFGKNYLATLLIYGIISLGIILLGTSLLAPMLSELPFGNVVACVAIYIILLPFIRQLLFFRNSYMTALWLRGLKNRLPLIVLMGARVLLAMLLLVMPLYWLLRFHPLLIVLIGVALTLLLFRLNKFTSLYLKIEARFLANFNERKLHEQYNSAERGEFGHNLNETLLVKRFVCREDSTILNIPLAELDWGRLYKTKIIKIVRGKKHINIPEGNEKILVGDSVLLLGEAKDLENFTYISTKMSFLQETAFPEMSLKEYIADQKADGAAEQLYCCAVNIGDAPQYVGKTLRESSLKQDWGCFLLGLERNMLPISDPSPDMMLEGNDLVWVLGSQQMGERLVEEGLV
jgi:CPA2 family monovalent cation:H+ antiporter-2